MPYSGLHEKKLLQLQAEHPCEIRVSDQTLTALFNGECPKGWASAPATTQEVEQAPGYYSLPLESLI